MVPPKVEYGLTALGATLRAAVQSLVRWTQEHQGEVAAALAECDRNSLSQGPS